MRCNGKKETGCTLQGRSETGQELAGSSSETIIDHHAVRKWAVGVALSRRLRVKSAEADQAVSANDVVNVPLYGTEANSAARLALQVVDDGSQGPEISTTATPGAVVQFLAICKLSAKSKAKRARG
jgi:hypothetical protein